MRRAHPVPTRLPAFIDVALAAQHLPHRDAPVVNRVLLPIGRVALPRERNTMAW